MDGRQKSFRVVIFIVIMTEMRKIAHNIILASNSPRRKELLRGLDIDFVVKVLPDVSESYPVDTPTDRIAEYISIEKSRAYVDTLSDNDMVITADTIVVMGDKVLGKPKNKAEAMGMLKMLSGNTHKVITGVCLATQTMSKSFSVETNVTFRELATDEIEYYVDNYAPFDKAGAYGIQEWIGFVAVTKIEGSYFNVVGFPVQRIYQEIIEFDQKGR